MKLTKLAAAGLAGLLLLVGCTGAAPSTSPSSGDSSRVSESVTASSTPTSQPADTAPSQSIGESISNEVYRGEVVSLTEALEGLSAGDLQEGVPVSAVTQGIASLSLPPQVPVIALLPFTIPERVSTE